MKLNDINNMNSDKFKMKKKLILEMEHDEPNVDPDLLSSTLTSFLIVDKSETPFLAIRNWIMYTKTLKDNQSIPNVSLTSSQLRNKSKIIIDYTNWLSGGSDLSKELKKVLAKEQKNAINKFLKSDNSTDLYGLIKEWEVKTFNTYNINKKNHVIDFVKQYKIK